MKWNAFEYIEPAINKTKQLLFPIEPKYWLRLGFVSLLTSMTKGNNFSSLQNVPGQDSKNITGNAINDIKNKLGTTTLIGSIIGIILLVFLLLSYIASIFNFIFIDAITNKQYKIRESFKKNSSKGLSFFLFTLATGLIFIIISILIFSPLLIGYLMNGISFFNESFIWIIILIPLIMIFIIILIIFLVFLTIINDFAVYDMFKNNLKASKAVNNSLKNIKNNKMEFLVYIIAKIVVGILIAMIGLVVMIPLIGILFVIAFVSFALYNSIGLIILIFVIPIILLMLYIAHVILLPLNVFSRYFSIFCFEKLYGTEYFNKVISDKKKK